MEICPSVKMTALPPLALVESFAKRSCLLRNLLTYEICFLLSWRGYFISQCWPFRLLCIYVFFFVCFEDDHRMQLTTCSYNFSTFLYFCSLKIRTFGDTWPPAADNQPLSRISVFLLLRGTWNSLVHLLQPSLFSEVPSYWITCFLVFSINFYQFVLERKAAWNFSEFATDVFIFLLEF